MYTSWCVQLIILYVEDENLTRMLVKRLLEKEGLEVYDASNGHFGFEMFLEIAPDAVVTNLAMPVVDGFQMIDNIREINTEIPIIVTTGYREEVKKLSSKINDCIYKPFIKESLLLALNKYLLCNNSPK